MLLGPSVGARFIPVTYRVIGGEYSPVFKEVDTDFCRKCTLVWGIYWHREEHGSADGHEIEHKLNMVFWRHYAEFEKSSLTRT